MNQTILPADFSPAQVGALRGFFSDRVRLFRELFRVVDFDGVVVPFQFRPAQAHIYPRLTGRDIILKARQLGFSTLVEADFLLDAVLIPNLRVLVVVQNEDVIPKFSAMFHNAVGTGLYDFLPEYLEVGGVTVRFRPALLTDNISTLGFDNGSIINVVTSGGVRIGRGQPIHRAHLTEVGVWDDETSDTVWAAIEGGMRSHDTKLIVESTACGQKGKFFKEWGRAMSGASGFRPHFYEWWWEPKYRNRVDELPLGMGSPSLSEEEETLAERVGLDIEQIYYRRKKRANMGDLFPQEYPENADEAFIATGGSVFTLAQREWARAFIRPPLIDDDGWRVWEEPTPDGRYTVIVDSSQGVTEASDFDAVAVLRVNPPYVDHVATWMGRATQREVAQRVAGIAERYNHAIVVVETLEGSGQTIGYILDEVLKYRNLYRRDDGGIGWKTTKYTKPGMVDSFKELVSRQWLRTPDDRVATQMSTYTERRLPSGAIAVGAGGSAYDDLLVCLLIGAAVLPSLSRSKTTVSHYGRRKW